METVQQARALVLCVAQRTHEWMTTRSIQGTQALQRCKNCSRHLCGKTGQTGQRLRFLELQSRPSYLTLLDMASPVALGCWKAKLQRPGRDNYGRAPGHQSPTSPIVPLWWLCGGVVCHSLEGQVARLGRAFSPSSLLPPPLPWQFSALRRPLGDQE